MPHLWDLLSRLAAKLPPPTSCRSHLSEEQSQGSCAPRPACCRGLSGGGLQGHAGVQRGGQQELSTDGS